MRRYCLVVKRTNEQLYEALKSAFGDSQGFKVIQDRRSTAQGEWPSDERRRREVWDANDLLIAEESEWWRP
jgi:hypothetical protein